MLRPRVGIRCSRLLERSLRKRALWPTRPGPLVALLLRPIRTRLLLALLLALLLLLCLLLLRLLELRLVLLWRRRPGVDVPGLWRREGRAGRLFGCRLLLWLAREEAHRRGSRGARVRLPKRMARKGRMCSCRRSAAV